MQATTRLSSDGSGRVVWPEFQVSERIAPTLFGDAEEVGTYRRTFESRKEISGVWDLGDLGDFLLTLPRLTGTVPCL